MTVPDNYWDLGLMEGQGHLVYSYDSEDGRITKRLALPIPEGTMDELEKLLGDGNASITVGKEIKMSADYRTAASTAWVKLTCNQDLQSVLKTREIATALALGFAQQGFEQAQYAMDKMCGRDVEPPEPLGILVDGAPVSGRKEDPEADRKQSARSKLLGKNKPSFKR